VVVVVVASVWDDLTGYGVWMDKSVPGFWLQNVPSSGPRPGGWEAHMTNPQPTRAMPKRPHIGTPCAFPDTRERNRR